MATTELRERAAPEPPPLSGSAAPLDRSGRLRLLPILLTSLIVAAAAGLGWAAWQAYMASPWTRDATVRAYVVVIAPEVAGRIVDLPVADNQFVHKGDTLIVIDPTTYAIAVEQAQASADQARANSENAERQSERRAQLSTLETSEEEKQTYRSNSVAANAAYRQAFASLARAKVDLERATIRSPVNGYVTNLRVQLGDYATVGQSVIAVVNTDSFWVEAYFEETTLPQVHDNDPATIQLMGEPRTLTGHVESVARGITVANAEAGPSGLATVNPIFTWVRLAQRVPVRLHIDHLPDGVRLVAGQTASVQLGRK